LWNGQQMPALHQFFVEPESRFKCIRVGILGNLESLRRVPLDDLKEYNSSLRTDPKGVNGNDIDQIGQNRITNVKNAFSWEICFDEFRHCLTGNRLLRASPNYISHKYLRL